MFLPWVFERWQGRSSSGSPAQIVAPRGPAHRHPPAGVLCSRDRKHPVARGEIMLLVGSENAGYGFAEGMRVLRRGGRALDAVEATIRRVESNPADHSVGYSGLPNILGEVE